ncbi:stage III sporulation protein AE [Acetivibrio clariflavus]|uniref:Stage III sporulation protein AE n=1 Tax=Acetivibrio clariflavus (strain DSM 19732 / NBRC 101661 / EBR45) TaxID=720554 RepID=G8LWK0_ACECE|nr:stage III sporulation protein AE [Acetivibrio clariflavus]AEV68668.1 stage III sporulation protein AE [Acetivibrio clariflavus DSM 19732]
MCRGNKRTFIYGFSKLICLFMFLTVFCVAFPGRIYAEETGMEQEIIEQQMDTDEVKSVGENLKKTMNEEFYEIMPGYNPEKLIKDLTKGEFKFDFASIFKRILLYLFKEVYVNIDLLIKLIVLAIICAVLNNLQSSFMSKSVGELAFYVCYIVLVSVLLISFNSALKSGIQIIDAMVNFMYTSIPVLITLLISGGNITSGGVLHPVLIAIVQFTAAIIKNVFVPLIVLSTVISIVNNISDKIQVARLASLLKNITSWSLGFILTIFVAVVSLQGSLGAVVDGVTSKTAKFAIGVFVPVAGKYLADAADTVIGCTLLIKNAVGVAIMIGIVSVSLIPMLKMLAIIGVYRLACVFLEPVAENRIIKCIGEVAGSITYIFGIVASVSFMFLLTVATLVTAGNLSSMMR